ncbi:MAG: DNA methyltransferase, partial [Gemmatimonadetes bacterium]|nr:DNA methyltransferase [Gemmatimonadota bacterium]
MVEKWQRKGHAEREIAARWNDYVTQHLLPRLHGYELLMAPYAIAHLKIGLKLYETGYRFASDERAQVYLTNALEPPPEISQITMDFLPALAREAEAVGRVKRERRFTVVIGNPPYLGEAGRGGEWIASLMRGMELPSKRRTLSYFEVDGKPLGERNPKWVNDLYVRFTRLSQYLIERAGLGVHGFITNHGYIDNPTFRGMRWALLAAFDRIAVVDLHGNTKKKEVPPDGGRDENVFDIEQGVAIGLFVKSSAGGEGRKRVAAASRVRHSDLWGAREGKYSRLLGGVARTAWAEVDPRPSFFLLKPFAGDDTGEYSEWPSIREVLPVSGTGVITKRDRLSIHFDPDAAWNTVTTFAELSDSEARTRFRLPPDVRDWQFEWAQKDVRDSGPSRHHVRPILYRPFDRRFVYYTGRTRGFIGWPVVGIMGHMLGGG